jgi:TolB-like protein/Flp pilus assembly protein TadD
MAGVKGVENSSKAEAQPLRSGVAGSSRPVFISYASPDAAVAQRVCAALEAAGILCWIAPRDVVPGTLYAEGIVRALDESRVLVLILSKDSVASAHVGKELERATSKRHPIIALRTDSAPLTPAFEYFLNESQWIDVGAGGTDGAIAKLTEAVRQHLAPRPAAAALQAPQARVRRAIPARRIWGIAAVVVVLALVAGYLLLGKAWLHSHGAATVPVATVTDRSIAVLPFVDMSEKKDQEYFGDGMAEEIIDLLVKIPGLKIIGRTSSFQFKGKTEDLRSIGTKLGVAYVLEGSVRKSGDHLRVTAQLIKAQDGTHLWSQTFDRDLSDVLNMQDEIATQVVVALQVEVSAGNDIAIRPALRNPEAYTLILQGLHAFGRYDQQGFEQALSDFQRVLDLDPTFAEAPAGISAAYEQLGEFGFLPAPEAFEQARQAAEHALKLEPNNALAHAMLGIIHMVYDWDWPAADAEFNVVRDLAPNDSSFLLLAGQQSLILGRWDDALKLLNTSRELDPLDPADYELLYQVQIRRGHLPEAEAAIRRTLDLSPTFAFTRYNLGNALLARGNSEAALVEYLKEPSDHRRLVGTAVANFALGRKRDSDAALAQLLKSQTNHPFGIAQVYAFRGESDDAFRWLERAFSQKDAALEYIKGNPLLKNIEGDPRYKAFLKKMNLPSD